MLKRTGLLAVLFLLFGFASFAQTSNGTVKGFVYDKHTGEPMIYTSVVFKGTKYGVQTDVNGYFSISLPPGSYSMYTTQVGYDTVIIDINVLANAIITKKIQ